MQYRFENGVLTLCPEGKINTSNAHAVEAEIRELREKYPSDKIVLDCDKLEYVSSAGLRVILRLKKEVNDTRLCNVHTGFYEILDTTGFIELMEVSKAFRTVSITGCELIGQGANGKVFRLDQENIIKVYHNADSLPMLQHERELSRTAFVLGIPTAIPYDVVQVKEGGYGSVYEMLNAKTYVQLFKSGEKSLDELAEMSIELLRIIHSHVTKQQIIPAIRDTALGWAMFLKDWLAPERFKKLYGLIEAVPDDPHLVHGDFHFRNIMFQNGESLLIDMDKFSHGHPVFELAAMYNAYCGFGAADPSFIQSFLDFDAETAAALWHKSLGLYLNTQDEQVLRAVEDKVKVVAYARILRHFLKRNGLDTEGGRKQISYSRAMLDDLLPRTDTLIF